ncbi:MAG: YdcF family protein [Saprospiraceae bacterium]
MFYILSKSLYFLIQPINWVIGLLLYSFFVKKPKAKRRSLGFAIVLALFFTNHFIFNQFMNYWEVDPISMASLQEPYDIGILLGGYSNFYKLENNDRHNFNERANRLTNALELYHTGKIKKILLSGGSGNLTGESYSEAILAKEYLLRIGIPLEDIIVESRSRNTRENALFTQQLLADKYPSASCLLITSAWHMPRAAACFEKLGLSFDQFGVDYVGEKNRFALESMLVPDRLGFYRWEILIKEWVGYVMYRLRGYL